MTPLPELEPAALEAFHRELSSHIVHGDGAYAAAIRAYLAARSAPEAGKAVVAWEDVQDAIDQWAKDELPGEDAAEARGCIMSWSDLIAQAVVAKVAALASVPAPSGAEKADECMWTDKPCTCGGGPCEQVDFGAGIPSQAVPAEDIAGLVARLEHRATTMNGCSPVGAGDGNTYAVGYYGLVDRKLDREAAAALTSISAERDEARSIVRDIHWMAVRYADNRKSYAVGMCNDALRKAYDAGWLKYTDRNDKLDPQYARDGMFDREWVSALDAANARATASEAEAADLRRKLEEAERRADANADHARLANENFNDMDKARAANLERAETAERKLEEARKALEPFGIALDNMGRSRLELHDRENIRGRGPDLAITMGDLRRARALSDRTEGQE